MSDIQKLNKVIKSLEEQSTRVSEFNGVLEAVNLAKTEITTTRNSFTALSEEQQKLVSVVYQKFDNFDRRILKLERDLSTIQTKMVCVDQFEAGRDKVIKRLSEFKFVSHEQLEESIFTSERKLETLINTNNERTEALIKAQLITIKSIRTTMILGMLLLAGGMVFLAKDAFL